MPWRGSAAAEVVKSVVGLKADGGGAAAAVSEETASAFASKHGAFCSRCSARDGANVSQIFETIGVRLVRNGFDADGTRRKGAGVKLGGKGAPKKKGCC